MQLTRPLRLPLSTGASPANFALGIGLFGFFGAAPVFIGSLLPYWVAVVCGVLIAAWFLMLVMLPFDIKRRRASDVLLSETGLKIEGGPERGQSISWDELSAQPPEFTRAAHGDTRLVLPRSIEVVTAEPDELVSLESLVQTLEALARGHMEACAPPVKHGHAASVPHCSNCGGPVAPSEQASVRCSHCQADTAIPEALRREVTHLRALTDARTVTSRALGVLSRWPRSRTINLVLGIAVIPLVLGWPASGVLASEFLQYRDVFSWRDVGVLFVSTAALTLGLCFWLAGQIVHRQAFGLVVATFHAVRSADGGLACRYCGAPLDVRPDKPLVSCAFCRCDNVVLGLDLSPRVAAESAQAASLDEILRARLRSMKRWRFLTAGSALLIVAGGLLLVAPLRRAALSPAPRHAPVDRAWSYPGPVR
jgi:hypothetical protein